MATYDIKAFIWIHISAVRYERAQPEVTAFYAGFYQALCRGFGFDLRRLPEGLPYAFDSAVGAILAARGAFDGSMEVPRLVGPLLERHSHRIGVAVEAVRQAHFALLLDIVEGVYGPCRKVLSSADLLALGFDDSRSTIDDDPEPPDGWLRYNEDGERVDAEGHRIDDDAQRLDPS